MSIIPPNVAALPPPLPPGWTEHKAPTGHIYYYHAQTNQSTYTRPIPQQFPTYPLPPNLWPQPVAPTPAKRKKPKKEKPAVKIPVPGTDWLRVKTTEGNVFWTHTGRKESVWVVPDDIKDVVAEMDWDELEIAQETERVKAEAAAASEVTKDPPNVGEKRKADEENVVGGPKKRKVSKLKEEVVQELDEIVIDVDVQDDGEEDDGGETESDEEDDEELEREAAAFMAAEEEKAKLESEQSPGKSEVVKEPVTDAPPKKGFAVPEQVNLSSDEAKALFKTLLAEVSPSPLLPFTSVLPSLVKDPRYILLSSQADRESVFNEWCREVIRASRLKGAAPTAQPQALAPREAYDQLLKEEAKSTRTTWDEFKRKWKKDRRFFGFGRDDREREKVFRGWLKKVGELKRAQAQKAETEFFALLKEHSSTLSMSPNSQWKDVKRHLTHDPRYDAVGSSSLREELFGTFLKALASSTVGDLTSPHAETQAAPEEGEVSADKPDDPSDRKARAQRGLKEREERVKVERLRIERDIGQSKVNLVGVEAEREFTSFLVDAVTDPTVDYQTLLPTFSAHPRFSSSPLSPSQKHNLFRTHQAHLQQKYLSSLHALFLSSSPTLSTKFSSLPLSSLAISLPATRLGLHVEDGSLERAYANWMRDREKKAKDEFQEMLGENSFIEFWGKVSKIQDKSTGDGMAIPNEEDDEQGGEEAGGKVDLKDLAKGVGEKQMEDVLKHDKRYRIFDHVPELREKWITDYISRLSAPKLSVHVPDTKA